MVNRLATPPMLSLGFPTHLSLSLIFSAVCHIWMSTWFTTRRIPTPANPSRRALILPRRWRLMEHWAQNIHYYKVYLTVVLTQVLPFHSVTLESPHQTPPSINPSAARYTSAFASPPHMADLPHSPHSLAIPGLSSSPSECFDIPVVNPRSDTLYLNGTHWALGVVFSNTPLLHEHAKKRSISMLKPPTSNWNFVSALGCIWGRWRIPPIRYW